MVRARRSSLSWRNGRDRLHSARSGFHSTSCTHGGQCGLGYLFGERGAPLENACACHTVITYMRTRANSRGRNFSTICVRLASPSSLSDSPTHVVCAWLWDSPTFAHNHYLQPRDPDFETAASEFTTHGAKSGAMVTQKAAPVGHSLDSHFRSEPRFSRLKAFPCDVLRNRANRLNDPKGIRTPVTSVKGRCPRPG
jgi:hypothetical protein